tara:strand:+ start:81 stop:314 length:234 start_codon:yes stop_codon:yes gene_type:complete
MKNLLYLLFVLPLLFSCGNSEAIDLIEQYEQNEKDEIKERKKEKIKQEKEYQRKRKEYLLRTKPERDKDTLMSGFMA